MRWVVVVGEDVDGGVQCASVVALLDGLDGLIGGTLANRLSLDLRRLKRSRDWSREICREKIVTC